MYSILQLDVECMTIDILQLTNYYEAAIKTCILSGLRKIKASNQNLMRWPTNGTGKDSAFNMDSIER